MFEHELSLLLWGVSRAFTHELGAARAALFPQISQRYVAGRYVRFVESPAHSFYPELHAEFEAWIDQCAEQYQRRDGSCWGVGHRSWPKATTKQRQSEYGKEARRCPPNETEAPFS